MCTNTYVTSDLSATTPQIYVVVHFDMVRRMELRGGSPAASVTSPATASKSTTRPNAVLRCSKSRPKTPTEMLSLIYLSTIGLIHLKELFESGLVVLRTQYSETLSWQI